MTAEGDFKLGDRVDYFDNNGWARGTVCHTGIGWRESQVRVRRDGQHPSLSDLCFVQNVRHVSAIDLLGELADG